MTGTLCYIGCPSLFVREGSEIRLWRVARAEREVVGQLLAVVLQSCAVAVGGVRCGLETGPSRKGGAFQFGTVMTL